MWALWRPHIPYDPYWRRAAIVRFWGSVAKLVVYLIATWLRVAPCIPRPVLPQRCRGFSCAVEWGHDGMFQSCGDNRAGPGSKFRPRSRRFPGDGTLGCICLQDVARKTVEQGRSKGWWVSGWTWEETQSDTQSAAGPALTRYSVICASSVDSVKRRAQISILCQRSTSLSKSCYARRVISPATMSGVNNFGQSWLKRTQTWVLDERNAEFHHAACISGN